MLIQETLDTRYKIQRFYGEWGKGKWLNTEHRNLHPYEAQTALDALNRRNRGFDIKFRIWDERKS